jgi:hypothetical protein
MGEAGRKDAAVEAAVQQLKQHVNGTPPQLHLKVEQAAAVFGCERAKTLCEMEANALHQMGQKEAAATLLSAAEHIAKFLTRYVADVQRVVIPGVVVP